MLCTPASRVCARARGCRPPARSISARSPRAGHQETAQTARVDELEFGKVEHHAVGATVECAVEALLEGGRTPEMRQPGSSGIDSGSRLACRVCAIRARS